jgi:two-component system chemotaxis sensor kinase CheA
MSRPDDTDPDTLFIAEALPAFVSEAREQIEGIEQLLLQLETAPDDRELLDALFRCAHTVKGSAGLFGLDAVVDFTHHVETLLDRLREGQLLLTPALSTLLLRSNDEIRSLVDAAAGQGTEDRREGREALVERLRDAAGDTRAAQDAVADADAPAGPGRWRVSVAFGTDTFRNGMDPLAILAYLGGLGRLTSIACRDTAVPPLEHLDPESCHLGFDLELETDACRKEIEHAFAFVRDDVELEMRRIDGSCSEPQADDTAAAAAQTDVDAAAGPGATAARAARPKAPPATSGCQPIASTR